MQLELTFSVHLKENNIQSQSHRDENEKIFSKQNKALYELLKSGKRITTYEAITQYGFGSLSRRLCDLKDAGVEIKSEWVYPDGEEKAKYKVYYL